MIAPTKSAFLNSRFRRRVVEASYELDSEVRLELWIQCARDPLFFINTFCWLLEARDAAEWQVKPRYGNAKELPFTLRQYQANAISEAVNHLGLRDIIMPKSRETGVTWIWVAIAAWDFIFHGQTHIGFVSKDEPSVDNPSDPDSLMSKLKFLLDRLPCWLRPPIERNVTNHTFKNLDNGSTITGYAATANLGRGGRKRWFLMDEFHFFSAGEDYLALDSTVDVTPCRVFVSTVNRDRGQSGAFYDLVTDDTRNGISIVIDWKDDEEKRVGLYHSERVDATGSHRLVIDDTEFWSQHDNSDGSYRHPTKPGEKYPFVVDGKHRSLYFDFRWFRPGSTPQSVAAELERDFGGATSQIVDGECLRRAITAAKAPTYCGDIVPDLDHLGEYKFVEFDDSGSVKIWCPLKDGKPVVGECVAGADISYGTGGTTSSYSALEILNKTTGEQVFEWRSNKTDPGTFAEMAVWICRWFNNAYLVPEKNGGGGTLFIKRVVELGYARLYHHIRPGIGYKVRTDVLGYFNQDGGIELLKGLEAALIKNRIRVHSVVALREAGRYFLKSGKLVHSGEQAAEDGAAKGKAHGDAAIALGAAVLGMDDWPAEKQEAAKPDAPYGSFLWRRQQYEKAQRTQGRKSYWSPTY